jgi:ubiquinone/menaquinone biosynthesis C-methylase UbiE
MNEKYSAALIDSIRKWHQDFHINGALPNGYLEENFLDVYLDKRIEYEAFQNLQARKVFDNNKGLRVLDIGSGIGKFISVSNQNGYDCIGLEPSQKACELVKDILKEEECKGMSLVCGIAESIPFPDDTFDVVISITVLEHVNDMREALSEGIRVLKEQGLFYLLVPNFLSFWEGHYKVFFIPYLLSLKSVFKLYVRLRGRNVECADSINFNINPFYLQRTLRSLGNVEIEDISIKRFQEKFNNPDSIVDPGVSSFVRLLTMFRTTRFLCSIGFKIIEMLGIYTPIILIIKKR